jgi:DNA-binding NtrC family response regulator
MARGKIMDTTINPQVNMDRLRILAVDDDPDMLEITTLLLDHMGYLVTPTTSSKDALIKIQENPATFNAALIDYGMPVINGIELAKMIKELSYNIPIILYTGKIEHFDRRQTAQAGILEIAKKPCKINDLDSIIKRAINKKSVSFY